MSVEPREYKKKNKPQIEFLTSSFGNSEGEIVKIRAEDATTVSYYDGFRRWCYLLKSEEGELWKWHKRPTDDM